VDPSVDGAVKACPGWLAAFKQFTLELECTTLDGTATNCWDAIESIQIHAYAKSAEDVTDKIKGYYDMFTDDFEGTNGRTQKTLWLTEVAYGGNTADDISSFIDDLMNDVTGLTNRALFPYVEKVSWFSEWNFAAFNVSGVAPAQYETWSSALFNPLDGSLTDAGETYFKYC
jgi:hypothetical protein